MRKWLVAFLLLSNALLFFGFVMIQGSFKEDGVDETLQGVPLVFVKDAQVQLVPRVDVADSRQQDVEREVVRSCYILSGIASKRSADEVSDFLIEQRYQPLVTTVTREGLMYDVVVNKGWQDRLEEVAGRLLQNDIRLRSVARDGEPVLLAGEFDDLRDAEALLAKAGAQKKHLVIQQRKTDKAFYNVRYGFDVGDKLVNKINAVLRDSYKNLKIEKKLCKGVAG